MKKPTYAELEYKKDKFKYLMVFSLIFIIITIFTTIFYSNYIEKENTQLKEQLESCNGNFELIVQCNWIEGETKVIGLFNATYNNYESYSEHKEKFLSEYENCEVLK